MTRNIDPITNKINCTIFINLLNFKFLLIPFKESINKASNEYIIINTVIIIALNDPYLV